MRVCPSPRKASTKLPEILIPLTPCHLWAAQALGLGQTGLGSPRGECVTRGLWDVFCWIDRRLEVCPHASGQQQFENGLF